MIRSHEFYFITSYETSSYENEIPSLKMINVYSAVSRNFQQELKTGCCGQICVSSFTCTTAMEQKKIPNLHEQNNGLLTAAKTTNAEQENITSIYSIITYYTSVENRQWGDVRSIMISCDKMHPISRLNVCVDGRGIFWLHTTLTCWLPVKIDLDFSTVEIISRKYVYYWDTSLRNQVQKTKKIETRNHLWLHGLVVLQRERN